MSYATLSKFNAFPILLAVGFGCFLMGNSARVIDPDEVVGSGLCTAWWSVHNCPEEVPQPGQQAVCHQNVWNNSGYGFPARVAAPKPNGSPNCNTYSFGTPPAACPAKASYDATFGCIEVLGGWT